MRCAAAGIAVLALALAHSGRAPEQPARPGPDSGRTIRRAITEGRMFENQPFSPGVLAGKTLYISGQAGRNPSAQDPAPGIRDQTRHALERIGTVLRAAGMGHPNLVKCHVYLASMDDYSGMNETYRSFFSERVPARTTIQAAGLPYGARVEIACVAFDDLSRISVVVPPKGSIPSPLGPYSAGVWAGDTLYLSGMGGQFPDGRPPLPGLGPQVTQTLANIGATLKAAGLTFSDVIAGEAYVTAAEDAGELPAAYNPVFRAAGSHPRITAFVPRLPGPIKVEITLVAARNAADRRVIPPVQPSDNSARAVRAGGVLYTRAESAESAGGDFQEQYRAVLKQQEATLRAAGMGWANVTDVQVYLADLKDLDRLDQMFRERFPHDPPARTTIQAQTTEAQLVQSTLVAVKAGGAR